VLATPHGFAARGVFASFRERIESLSIKVIENEPWDCIGHADLALAASGTVTMEAAVLGTPMVTFYKVTALSWHAGRRLVKVPFLSMANLIAERKIVPELIQDDMTPQKICEEAARLLSNVEATAAMRRDLAAVRLSLTRAGDPFARAANVVLESLRVPLQAAGE
jgi:lipid-A-disaccharide synthase